MPVHRTPFSASYPQRERGSVLVFVLILLVVVGGAVAASAVLFSSRAQATAASVEESRGTYAAEGALEFAYATIWESYLAFYQGDAGTLTAFREMLPAILIQRRDPFYFVDRKPLLPKGANPSPEYTRPTAIAAE